jgi:uridine phosphorylase
MAQRPKVGAKAYHILLAPGEAPRYVLLPGDPGRVPSDS